MSAITRNACVESFKNRQRKTVVGLPSASSLDRILACPGSFNASRDIENEPNPNSEMGHILHEAMYLAVQEKMMGEFDLSSFSEDEQILLIHASECMNELFEQGWAVLGKEYFHANSFMYGTADVVMESFDEDFNRSLLIIDYKFGRSLVSTHMNMQLMAHVALLEIAEKNDKMFGMIIQEALKEHCEMVEFNKTKCFKICCDTCEEARSETALQQPGYHCCFCPAKSTDRCAPTSLQTKNALEEIPNNAIFTTTDARSILDKIQMVEDYGKKYRRWLLDEVLSKGIKVPGVIKAGGGKVREINSNLDLLAEAKKRGFSEAQLIAIASFSIADVESLIGKLPDSAVSEASRSFYVRRGGKS